MFKVITIFAVILIWLLCVTLAWADTEQGQVLQQAIELFHAKRYSESQTLLTRLVDTHPENATAHYYLGRIYLQVQVYDKAIAHCHRAVSLQATEAEHHFCLGLSYGQKARQAPFWQQALLAPKIRKALEMTVSLDPAHVPARIGLARFYLLIVPRCSISPKFLKLLKRGHENASQATRANPPLASICA